MEEPTDIQKLLRLKRYEKPPEGYFDDFLIEFQRRQRTELLRVPMHQFLWDRTCAWLDQFRVPTMAYATIAVLGVGTAALILGNLDGTVEGSSPVAVTQSINTLDSLPAMRQSPALPPSYVLETRPVSYESPFSF